jgi:hypothetical protein
MYELNVNGTVAESLAQARKALAQGKLTLIDGDTVKTPEQVGAGNFKVCALSGEIGSLLITSDNDYSIH